MSDEYQRRRGPLLALVALLGLLGFGVWLRGRVIEDARTFKAFCDATHVGETWEHVQERAAAKGWGFVRQSKTRTAAASSGTLRETAGDEWLCQVEMWSYRAGCVVTVAKGRVIATRFAELP
ncbi:MAG: hypothetical protein Q8L48_43500 [Archangium sp.]|nr:hypothetical protein [Archangium sp.]